MRPYLIRSVCNPEHAHVGADAQNEVQRFDTTSGTQRTPPLRISGFDSRIRSSLGPHRSVAITIRLVDTAAIAMLLKLVRSGKLQPAKLVTHRFALDDIMNAYDTFGNAAKNVR
jgi:hypothetical protein